MNRNLLTNFESTSLDHTCLNKVDPWLCIYPQIITLFYDGDFNIVYNCFLEA